MYLGGVLARIRAWGFKYDRHTSVDYLAFFINIAVYQCVRRIVGHRLTACGLKNTVEHRNRIIARQPYNGDAALTEGGGNSRNRTHLVYSFLIINFTHSV